jgi:membrane-associated protease RseP (regulator of RpoE activity)
MSIENVMLLTLVAAPFGVIFIHEVGHLVVARILGIKVPLLTVGLGPRIVSMTDRFGTRWQLALLPIGGSCGIVENSSAEAVFLSDRKRLGRPAAEAPLLHRAMVYLAGPLANVVFACVLFLFLLCRAEKLSIASPEDVETQLVVLTGALSLFVGMFNLLPILPLDGGRLTLLAFEAWGGRRFSKRDEQLFFSIGISLLVVVTLISVFIFIGLMSNVYGLSPHS